MQITCYNNKEGKNSCRKFEYFKLNKIRFVFLITDELEMMFKWNEEGLKKRVVRKNAKLEFELKQALESKDPRVKRVTDNGIDRCAREEWFFLPDWPTTSFRLIDGRCG